jgi:hypothetical protein
MMMMMMVLTRLPTMPGQAPSGLEVESGGPWSGRWVELVVAGLAFGSLAGTDS